MLQRYFILFIYLFTYFYSYFVILNVGQVSDSTWAYTIICKMKAAVKSLESKYLP